MKNVSRNKFLLCFRPVVDMDGLVLDSEGGSRSGSQSLKYIGSGNGQPISDNDQCSKVSGNSMMVSRPSKRTLSRVMKAVLFETILAKRVRDRKSLWQDSFRSRRSFSRRRRSLDSEDDKSARRLSVDHTDIQEIKSNPAVLSSQSSVRSSSSFCSSSSISQSKRQQERVVKPVKNTHKGSSSSFSCCISLLLMSLAVTILWGRICAILFTSIWLFYLPQERTCRPENMKRPSKKEPRVYKKRIILEGLL